MPRVEHKIKKRIKIQRSGNSEWDRVKARLDEAYEEGHRVGVEDGFNNAQANFQIRAKEMEKSLHAAHLDEIHKLNMRHKEQIRDREAALSFYLKRLTLDQINAAQDEYDEWLCTEHPPKVVDQGAPLLKKSLALEELANMSPEQILEWLEGDAPEVRLQDGRSIGVTMTKVKIPARAGTWTATDSSGLNQLPRQMRCGLSFEDYRNLANELQRNPTDDEAVRLATELYEARRHGRTPSWSVIGGDHLGGGVCTGRVLITPLYRNDPSPGCVLPNSPYIDGTGDLEIIERLERPECAHDTEVTDDTGPEEDSPF